VWKLKALYHSDEKRAILQFDPGGTTDARLLERLKNMWLLTTYNQVSHSIRVKCNELTCKRAIILMSLPLNISKSHLVYNSSTPTCILGTQWPEDDDIEESK
jgi:hypothetical protein